MAIQIPKAIQDLKRVAIRYSEGSSNSGNRAPSAQMIPFNTLPTVPFRASARPSKVWRSQRRPLFFQNSLSETARATFINLWYAHGRRKRPGQKITMVKFQVKMAYRSFVTCASSCWMAKRLPLRNCITPSRSLNRQK